jgi:hypothetical protein
MPGTIDSDDMALREPRPFSGPHDAQGTSEAGVSAGRAARPLPPAQFVPPLKNEATRRPMRPSSGAT